VRNQQIAASSVLPEQATLDDPFSMGGMVVGNSKAMQDVAMMIRQVALYPTTTILLQGESGTGKDVVARAIHTASRLIGRLGRRSAYEFVDINCAAIPETLLETELFGVEMGAYTDAKTTREGKIIKKIKKKTAKKNKREKK